MTLTPNVTFDLNAWVTPADTLAVTNDRYRLGFVNKSITMPAGATQIFTRSLAIPAATTLDLTLQTMLLEGGSAQYNADGVALALTKIYALVFEITAMSGTAETIAIDAAAAASAWTAYPALMMHLLGVGSIGMMMTLDEDGYAVDSGDQLALTAGAGTGTITVKMIAFGYQA